MIPITLRYSPLYIPQSVKAVQSRLCLSANQKPLSQFVLLHAPLELRYTVKHSCLFYHTYSIYNSKTLNVCNLYFVNGNF